MRFLITLVLLLSAGLVSAQGVWCPSCQTFHDSTTANNYGSGVVDALQMLNAQRRRAGLYALVYDPSLDSVAARRVVRTATWRGGRFAGHPTPINIAPARGEGVGYTSGTNPNTVSACYTSTTSHRYAACKLYRYAGKSWFCLLVR